MKQQVLRQQHTKTPTDPLRLKIHNAIQERGMSPATLSRVLGQPAVWLEAYLYQASPQTLPDHIAIKLGNILGVHIPLAGHSAVPEVDAVETPPFFGTKPPKLITQPGHPVPSRLWKRKFSKYRCVVRGWRIVPLLAPWCSETNSNRFSETPNIWVKHRAAEKSIWPEQTYAVEIGRQAIAEVGDPGEVIFVKPGRPRRIDALAVVEMADGTVVIRRIAGFEGSTWLFRVPGTDSIERLAADDFLGFDAVAGSAPLVQVDRSLADPNAGRSHPYTVPKEPRDTNISDEAAVVLLRYWREWCEDRQSAVPLWAAAHPGWPGRHNGSDQHLHDAAARFMARLEAMLPVT